MNEKQLVLDFETLMRNDLRVMKEIGETPMPIGDSSVKQFGGVCETSIEAFNDKLGSMVSIRSHILQILKEEGCNGVGLNTDTICHMYMLRTGADKTTAIQDVRPRLTELRGCGELENPVDEFDVELKTKSKFSGKKQMHWKIKKIIGGTENGVQC